MQNNGKHIKQQQSKGFYIILSICAVVIAISGYVLFFAPIGDTSMDSMEYTPDLPHTTWEPESDPIIEQSPSLPTSDTVEEVEIPELPVSSEEMEEPVVSEQDSITETSEVQTELSEPVAATEPVWVRPVDGEVVQEFSGDTLIYQETFGDWRVHAATDYFCAAGERVYAIQSGEITEVTQDDLWATSVTLQLDDGRTAIYRGLTESVKVNVGSHVSAGDVLGTVADTLPAEAQQGSHLHFELLDVDGIPVDPEQE